MAHLHITDTVVSIRMIHFYLVNELGFLRILQIGIYLERGRSIEIAVFLQQVLRYFDTYIGIHRRDKDRLGGEFIEDPFSYLSFFIHELIIDPQTEWERYTDR